MAALSATLPKANTLLCRWHISKNILAKKRTAFPLQEDFDRFLQDTNWLVNAATEEAYNHCPRGNAWLINSQTVHYLVRTWLILKITSSIYIVESKSTNK